MYKQNSFLIKNFPDLLKLKHLFKDTHVNFFSELKLSTIKKYSLQAKLFMLLSKQYFANYLFIHPSSLGF